MSFENQLFDWIDESLSEPIEDSVIAFSFNLYESFEIELIGSKVFDANDSDWACSEDFVPTRRSIEIPESVCREDWEDCLRVMTSMVKRYLSSGRKGAHVLQSSRAVAIGFVDGDLSLIA